MQSILDFFSSGINFVWVLVALIVVWIVAVFNGLVRVRNRVQEAWADIDVQLKRRHDLVPNLVEIVKGYAAHEKSVFEDVTKARAQALGAHNAGNKEDMASAENALSGTLKTLFAVAEDYPDLKANQNFLALQQELTDTEDKIQAARRFYNGMVMDLNTRIQTFPTNLIAALFKFTPEEFFQTADQAEREPVAVKF
jgi:LemA protein